MLHHFEDVVFSVVCRDIIQFTIKYCKFVLLGDYCTNVIVIRPGTGTGDNTNQKLISIVNRISQ